MKPRKMPERKCVVCQQMLSKRGMIRVIRTPEGTVELDPTGKKNGRGAYLCGKAEGFRKARKTKALERALKVSISDEIYGQLEEAFEGAQAKYAGFACGAGQDE